MQLTWEWLAEMRENDDPLQLAKAYHFLSMACLYTHNLAIGKRYQSMAFEIIKRNDIRFVPHSSGTNLLPSTREFSEEVHERATFLGQLVYSELDLQLVVGEPAELSADLEQQFRYELPVNFSSTFLGESFYDIAFRMRTRYCLGSVRSQ